MNPDHGARFLAAHGALRLILAGYLGLDPHGLRFSSGPWGKPALENAALDFNLSHSGALALIAVASARQVGVDVEEIRPIADRELLADRVCTADELASLRSVATAARDGAFLALWTRKEALAKLSGAGVTDMARDVTGDAHDGALLVQVNGFPGYAACVAAEGMTWRLVHRDVIPPTG